VTSSRVLYAATIFTSGFLLFIVQPIAARQILPWFGGTAGVWTTCLMFFQVALVAGYAYSNWTTKYLSQRVQAGVHIGLLVVSLLSLPIVASPAWKPTTADDPTWRILGFLLATIGLPYFVLCTTGPLVQVWFARAFPGLRVYRLFALSNLASLVGLALYPFFFDPLLTTTAQAQIWSVAYAVFALLCLGTALPGLRTTHGIPAPLDPATALTDAPKAAWSTRLLWLVLPALGTWLLLGVTNHITQNIASVPFLWMLPLTLYLASFIICFDHERWYDRAFWIAPALSLLVAAAYGLQTDDITLNARIAVPLYAGGLFAWCVFCHGELARLKPAARELTSYYLMIAAGGAIGGLLVGLAAPRLLESSYELGFGLVLTALVGVILLRKVFFWTASVAALAAMIACGYYSYQQIEHVRASARVLKRNFYGTLRTEDIGSAGDFNAKRQLVNGIILHGEQLLLPERRLEPTSYYGPTSGIAVALRLLSQPARRIGVIGLGTGSLAAYGRAGDQVHFFDINPQVEDIARTEFTYLSDSAAAIEVTLGDARLALERLAPQQFDVLVVDAFSSDSIPIHLLTTEAMDVYLRHMKPDGVVIFHVSNRFFDLAPVIKAIGDAKGQASALLVDNPEDPEFAKTDWVLVTNNQALLGHGDVAAITQAPTQIPGLRAWTDEAHNLFKIFR
jgi:SAM-dependent methyltransferase